MVEYKFDLRKLWSSDPQVRQKMETLMVGRMKLYQKWIDYIDMSIENGRGLKVKFRGEVYKFEHMPVELVYIVLADYWQARAFTVDVEEFTGRNLDVVADFVELVWRLELSTRKYWKKVVKLEEDVHGFIDTDSEFMNHDRLEHREHLEPMLMEYRNGDVELKMFYNRLVEYFC